MRIIRCLASAGLILPLFAASTTFAVQSIRAHLIDPAVDGFFAEPHIDGTYGWTFGINSPITVTDLGFYDQGGDGLLRSHQVGIWQVNNYKNPTVAGPLLTSALIPAGTGVQLDGPWRKVAIPPIILLAGSYAIGGQDGSTSTDPIIYRGNIIITTPSNDPRIVIGDASKSASTGFSPPIQTFLIASSTESGPIFYLLPVPEPTCFVLAVCSLIGVLPFLMRCKYRC
jgi:hypothetical protein